MPDEVSSLAELAALAGDVLDPVTATVEPDEPNDNPRKVEPEIFDLDDFLDMAVTTEGDAWVKDYFGELSRFHNREGAQFKYQGETFRCRRGIPVATILATRFDGDFTDTAKFLIKNDRGRFDDAMTEDDRLVVNEDDDKGWELYRYLRSAIKALAGAGSSPKGKQP